MEMMFIGLKRFFKRFDSFSKQYLKNYSLLCAFSFYSPFCASKLLSYIILFKWESDDQKRGYPFFSEKQTTNMKSNDCNSKAVLIEFLKDYLFMYIINVFVCHFLNLQSFSLILF